MLADRPSEIACRSAACGARFGSRRVGAAHDHGQPIQGWIGQVSVLDKGIEATELALLGKRLSPGNIVGRGTGFAGSRKKPIVRYVDELGIRFDESPDQPWAGDTIDLRTFARDPLHGSSPHSRADATPERLEDTSVSDYTEQ
jgi:hypothetical protein